MEKANYNWGLVERPLQYFRENYGPEQLFNICHDKIGMTISDMEHLGLAVPALAWEDPSVSLISVYEELMDIPAAQQVVCYVPRDGSHVIRPGTPRELVDSVYTSALGVLGIDDKTFRECGDYQSRAQITCRMRDRLLLDRLQVGETVLFVNTEPYGGPGDFSLRGGVIKDVDRDHMTCSVQGAFFTMDNVPLHYVLARYDRDSAACAYGFDHAVPFFREDLSLAAYCRSDAEMRWDAPCAEREQTMRL